MRMVWVTPTLTIWTLSRRGGGSVRVCMGAMAVAKSLKLMRTVMRDIRPTLKSCPGQPGLNYRNTYFRVLEATASVRSLIHGRLHNNGNSCAIGTYFKQSTMPINTDAIDEIATYNDSFPHLTQHERWKKVRKWLKFQVAKMS